MQSCWNGRPGTVASSVGICFGAISGLMRSVSMTTPMPALRNASSAGLVPVDAIPPSPICAWECAGLIWLIGAPGETCSASRGHRKHGQGFARTMKAAIFDRFLYCREAGLPRIIHNSRRAGDRVDRHVAGRRHLHRGCVCGPPSNGLYGASDTARRRCVHVRQTGFVRIAE